MFITSVVSVAVGTVSNIKFKRIGGITRYIKPRNTPKVMKSGV